MISNLTPDVDRTKEASHQTSWYLQTAAIQRNLAHATRSLLHVLKESPLRLSQTGPLDVPHLSWPNPQMYLTSSPAVQAVLRTHDWCKVKNSSSSMIRCYIFYGRDDIIRLKCPTQLCKHARIGCTPQKRLETSVKSTQGTCRKRTSVHTIGEISLPVMV